MIKRVFYNAGAQILGKGFTAGTTLIVTLLVGRSLGPAGFGDFTKIFEFVGYFYTFSDFGLNSIYVAKSNPKNEAALFRVLVSLRLVMALIFVALTLLVGFFLPYNAAENTGFGPVVKIGIAVASLTILTQALYTSANSLFQKKLRYDLSTIAAVTGAIAILLTVFLISLEGASVIRFAQAYVVGGIVTVFSAYLILYAKWQIFVLPKIGWGAFLNYLSKSWPVGLALILNLIYFRVDVLILAWVRQPQEVGIYGLAYQFFESSLAIPIFFVNAIYPLLANVYRQNQRKFYKDVKFWILMLFSISVVLSIFLILVSFLIPFLYDVRFTPSTLPLVILASGIPFFFLSALLWHVLIIFDRQKNLVLVYGAGALFNLIANLIFIPKFGYIAAAVTTVVSEAFILFLLIVIVLAASKLKTANSYNRSQKTVDL